MRKLSQNKQAAYMRAYRAARPHVRAKNRAYSKEWIKQNPKRRWFLAKKGRAKEDGIEFTLEYETLALPETCPIFGFELLYGGGGKGCNPRSASMDRLDPRKGYTAANVLVVSHLANTIKSNATPDQIMQVALFYKRLAE